jgi:hypothetical protein
MTTNIKDYSTTQANNTSLNGIDVNEGMLPSNLNNAIRALMKNTRDWFNSAEWIEYGDGSGAFTAAYASATSFTIAGADVTSVYHAGRRIKLTAATPGTIFGTIASSSFSTNTTVNVTWDSGSLASEAITTAKIAADAVNGTKIADDSIDSEHYVDGSIDTAHIANSQITVDKMAVNSVNSDQYVDGSIDLIHLSADSVDGTKIADDSINSEHYVDGSIDTAHIADANVTLAKLATGSVNSAKIVDDSIVNADINSSAAIAATKIHDGTISNTEFGYLNGVSSAIQTQIDTKATTAYVNDAVAGLRTRIIAECATTGNVDLSADLQNGDTIDGVTLVTGDRVLVKDQSTGSQNGLYTVVASGTASRDTQFDTIAELSGQMVVVNQGSTNDNKIFLCTTNNTASLGSDTITFSVITPSNVGTVTSVGIADAGAGEFTVGSTPVTSSGNITLAINSIADSKLATISTAGKVDIGALEIDGATDIGANLASTDLIIVDDGANGTERKCALSRVSTFIENEGFSKDDPTALAIALG